MKQPRAANGAAPSCLQTIFITGCVKCAKAGNVHVIYEVRPNMNRKHFVPKRAVFFTLNEFTDALQFADAVTDGKIPDATVMPEGRGILLKNDDGTIEEIALTNHSYNRFGYAVLTHFKGNGVKYHSFMARFEAWGEIVKADVQKELEDALPPEKHPDISKALFEAAATLPLQIPGSFDRSSFLARVRQLLNSYSVE